MADHEGRFGAGADRMTDRPSRRHGATTASCKFRIANIKVDIDYEFPAAK
jgi:hypothetical protein